MVYPTYMIILLEISNTKKICFTHPHEKTLEWKALHKPVFSGKMTKFSAKKKMLVWCSCKRVNAVCRQIFPHMFRYKMLVPICNTNSGATEYHMFPINKLTDSRFSGTLQLEKSKKKRKKNTRTAVKTTVVLSLALDIALEFRDWIKYCYEMRT